MLVKRKEFKVKRKQFVVKRKAGGAESCVKLATADIYFVKISYSGKYQITHKPYYLPKRKAIQLKMKLEKILYGPFELHDKG